MLKVKTKNELWYNYDCTRKRTPYTMDESHWMNRGNMAEIARRSQLGLSLAYDHSMAAWNEGSDITELEESVKSSQFSLTNAPIGETLEESINNYFQGTASSSFSYVTFNEDTITSYVMTADEFERFLNRWGRWEKKQKKVRGPKESSNVIRWLEARVRES